MPVHPRKLYKNNYITITIIHNQIDNYYIGSILNSFIEEESTINWGSDYCDHISVV